MFNSKNFVSDAIRTESKDFDGFRQRLAKSDLFLNLLGAVARANEALEDLDQAKKAIFYGKQKKPFTDENIKAGVEASKALGLNQEKIEALSSAQSEQDLRLLHAAIGVATEGAELVSAVMKKTANGQAIDLVNVSEECGDVFWYLALAADARGESMEDTCERVIAKLRVRYPEKFAMQKADERDLDSERKVLEANKK